MIDGLLHVGGGRGRRACSARCSGLGGGMLIVPLLTLGFGLPLRRGGRRQPGLRDHDQRRCRRRLPGATRREPPAGHDARAVHGHRCAGRRPDRVPAARARPGVALRAAPRLRGADDGPRDGRGRRGRPVEDPARDRRTSRAGSELRSTRLSGPGYRVHNLGFGVVGSVGPASSRPCSGSAAGSSRCP